MVRDVTLAMSRQQGYYPTSGSYQQRVDYQRRSTTDPGSANQSFTSDELSNNSYQRGRYNSEKLITNNNQPAPIPRESLRYSQTSRQYIDVHRYPLKDMSQYDSDSGITSPSVRDSRSWSSDGDLESLASARTRTSTDNESVTSSAYDPRRYQGELYRPVAAPRKINKEAYTIFGEIHPKKLRPEQIPTLESSGDETDSIATPTPRPRSSTRSSRSVSISFLEDDAIREENRQLKSILKPYGIKSSSKKVVRFEYVDKKKTRKLDTLDYSDIDSVSGDHSKPSKDIWKIMSAPPSGVAKSKDKPRRSSSSRRSSSGGHHRSHTGSNASQRSNRSISSKPTNQKEKSPQKVRKN